MRTMTVEDAVQWASERVGSGSRTVLGLAGCPGVGKSTLSGRLLEELGADRCVVVPMDGFHLDNAVLEAHGTRSRKGAPFTFDGAGFASLLTRLRDQRPGEVVYAPRYDRATSTSVAGAIEVAADVPLVITEVNYLLLDEEPWRTVRGALDESWFVHVPDEVRLPRLIARHISFGKAPDEAKEWVYRSDETNAALVKASSDRADAMVVVA